MSQKEEVATHNKEQQVRYIHWAKNLRRMHGDTNESDVYI